MEGSALATILGMVVAVLIPLLYFRWPHRTLHFCSIFRSDSREIIGGIFKNGAPASLRMLFACASLLFLNYVVGQEVGVSGIALLTVCGNIQLIAVAFFSAAGQAAMPMEGVLYGERDFSGLRLLVFYVLRVTLICVAVLVLTIWLFPSQIVALFVPGGIEGSDWLMRLYALGFIPLAVNYIMLYHYNTVQRRSMAVALMLCENLIFYVPLIWFLTSSFGLVEAVTAFVCAESLTTAFTFAAAVWLKRKEGLSSVLLIPDEPREIVYEATVPATGADAAAVAREVKGALDECGTSAVLSVRAAMAVEELVANAASGERRGKRPAHFDVRASILPDCVQITLRDNGMPFDPTCYEPDDQEGLAIDRISALKAVASSVDYRHTLGLTQTVIQVREVDEDA